MTLAAHYFIGHGQARTLRGLVGDAAEAEAVERLASFAGTPADVRLVVAVLERNGRSDEAADLQRMADGN